MKKQPITATMRSMTPPRASPSTHNSKPPLIVSFFERITVLYDIFYESYGKKKGIPGRYLRLTFAKVQISPANRNIHPITNNRSPSLAFSKKLSKVVISVHSEVRFQNIMNPIFCGREMALNHC